MLHIVISYMYRKLVKLELSHKAQNYKIPLKNAP